MSAPLVTPSQLDFWREWIGRTEECAERLDPEAARRYAAALGEELDVESRPPSLMHWAFFLPVFRAQDIGPDGHPARGGFIPPIALPRRMFAGSSMRFEAELRLGRDARRLSTIRDVTHKTGRTGELVLVEIEHRIEQDGRTCIEEKQTLVYRGAGEPQPAIVPLPVPPAGDEPWNPGVVDLFRFSAVTFNSHRIHYDLPYATQVEGYPALVVHGVYTAARLHRLARGEGPALRQFAFRAMAPLFQGQPIALVRGEGDEANEVRALRCDGALAMSATFG